MNCCWCCRPLGPLSIVRVVNGTALYYHGGCDKALQQTLNKIRGKKA